ncbi:uncharacterized protein IUM83_13171 [Phytophthora cinnamomi]|uniref:uncharacterized protein n=1 Tax=Phytophthora cinnamomi TaxID=4785 RepID=UPI00355A5B33|nr:hypothetical protein IUM83_13171 [Phytophthora cinnamomi]
MKFAAIAIAAIVAMANVVAGAGVDQLPAVMPPAKALELAQTASTPDGVKFTGSVEKIEQPAGAKESIEALQTKHHDVHGDNHESFGWGLGAGYGWGLGGWGNWGGWGGFGPYRFGFSCGGVPGWAYPLGYWNMFGAGLYGGSCSLDMPFGGLYYC